MADKAQELHVCQMQNFLGLLKVSEVHNDKLSIVRHVALVNHQRVVCENTLLQVAT